MFDMADSKDNPVAEGANPTADAFAACQDYNQKVDLIVYQLCLTNSDAQGKKLVEQLNAWKGSEGPRGPLGGPADEDPGATGSDVARAAAERAAR